MVFVQAAAIEAQAIGQRAHSGDVTLHDISLTIGYRELVAIIGGSGSGKTTLLDALSGLRPPASGMVLRAPVPAAGYQRNIRQPSPIVTAYVPEDDTIHPVLPLSRALRYTAALRGVGGDAAEVGAAVDAALRMVDLAFSTSAPVGDLNPGERKRAAIAAELLTRPLLLFLEEPTANLDPAQGAEVMRVLRHVADSGTTVVLTTSRPLDAARCDKVAVLATGGHLAFFGTPGAACGYFGADSLDEIYERLAGLGDPAAAWSRRFFHFSRSRVGFPASATIPQLPGAGALLVPDTAGPLSAGPVSTLVDENEADDDVFAALPGQAHSQQPPAAPARVAVGGRLLRPFRQLPVLISRNGWALTRWRPAQIALAAAPLAAALVFSLLLAAGALDGPAAVSLAWAVLGGLAVGMAYGLATGRGEVGGLRCERFAGLSTWAYVLARAIVLLLPLAVADLLILAVPGLSGRLPAGSAYLALALASLVGLAVALARTVLAATPRR
jgi:ABC-type multidrug transport system ATPase subunit